MVARSRRAAGPVFVALSTVIVYMGAVDHARSSLRGDYSVGHERPLDLWTRFPKSEWVRTKVYICIQSINTLMTPPLYLPTELDDDTSAVFALLNENQHPNNCHARKYFLWAPLNWGIGSDIHTIGAL